MDAGANGVTTAVTGRTLTGIDPNYGELNIGVSKTFAEADIEWRLSGLQQAGRLPVEALAPIIDSTHTEG